MCIKPNHINSRLKGSHVPRLVWVLVREVIRTLTLNEILTGGAISVQNQAGVHASLMKC